MVLNTLILELGDCTMSILPKTDLKADYAQMQSLIPARGNYSSQIIYYCKWSDLQELTALPEITVILWDDRPTVADNDDSFLSSLSGGLIFRNQEEYFACLDCFENCYLTAYRTDEQLAKISDSIYHNGGIQVLANQIASE